MAITQIATNGTTCHTLLGSTQSIGRMSSYNKKYIGAAKRVANRETMVLESSIRAYIVFV